MGAAKSTMVLGTQDYLTVESTRGAVQVMKSLQFHFGLPIRAETDGIAIKLCFVIQQYPHDDGRTLN